MTPDPRLDTLAYTLGRYRAVATALAFRPGDASWKPQARARLATLIGLPTERVPLEPSYGAPRSRPGYTMTPVTFRTRPGLVAFGYLLVPGDVSAPRPAVVCLPGHGRGVDEIVGLDEDGKDRDHDDGYQHDFALQCVRHGYVALAIEMIGFGHRRDEAARKAGPSTSSCQTSSGAALMLGETMVGWRTWDALRAIDLLETRAEVDPKRVAMMGISGGGTVILYAAALDERVKVAVLSGSFCTFRDSIYSLSHCIDNFVPGLLRDFEAADLAAMIAPRGLIAESGREDAIFPEKGVETVVREARDHYAAQGAADRLHHAFFEGGHVFDGKAAFEALKSSL